MNSAPLAFLRRPLFAVLSFAALALGVRAQTILPNPTAGQPYSFQITTQPPQSGGTTYAEEGFPSGLSIDAATGLISGTTVTVGTFKGNLSFTTSSGTTLYPYQITVDPAPGTPVITSSGGPVGTVGQPFSYTIEATNSPTNYTIAPLPPGLSASGALITGTPTTAGLYFSTISANNGNGQGKLLVLMFTISPAGPLPVVTSPLVIKNAVGAPFRYQITASNNPTSFSATPLPSGLSLDSASGVISGTPDTPGVSVVKITATNTYGTSLKVTMSLTIGNYSSITSGTSIAATVGSAFSYQLQADNNPYTFNLSGLPAGLTYNDVSGLVSGTPTTAGSYTVTASADNALGTGPELALTFTVTNASGGGGNLTAPSILAQPQDLSATIGSTVQISVTAVGSGTLAYQWSHNNTPISGATAAILALGGLQAADAGTYSVTVTNSLGSVTSRSATLTVLSIIVPPAITADPEKVTASVGTSARFSVGATGSVPLSYQWLVNGAPIAGATQATLNLPDVKLADAGVYSVVVSNPFGSKTSIAVPLTVSATAIAPIFQFHPSPTTVTTGGTATLSVGVVGSSPISYQWYKDGQPIGGATSTYVTFNNAQPGDAGTYNVTITNPAGTVTSLSAALTVTPAGSPPIGVSFAQQPQPLSTAVGSSATFAVGVTGDPAITYQWRRNQVEIAGATSSSFTINNVQSADAGIYDVVVANGFSADISFPTLLIVTPGSSITPVPSRLMNLSVRAYDGNGDQALALGFIIGGSGSKTTLLRAVGPTLANFGVTGLLADPQVTLFSSGSAMASNDNWGGSTTLSDTFSKVGAFALPASSPDAALVTTLNAGPYTAQVSGANNGTGVTLMELYDTDPSATPSARLVNVSARGMAGNGSNVLTVGFVISGNTGEKLLVRAVGPSLAGFNVAGVLADPQLRILDVNGNVVGSNDDWTGTALGAAFTAVNAFALPAGSKDAAVLVTLGPGVYTAQVRSSDNSTGIALLEVYEVP
ncbi:MAG TPA: immunoglobulin domain-containing protein [Opitutaceae bacterium]|nr:immunoglobulin domain-containing protein [Opitutaceae bacterium]